MSRTPVSSVVAASLIAVVSSAPARAQTTGVNATHDPSRIVESNGKFFFCSTGGSCASSTDGLAWAATGLRLTVPSWSTTYTPGGNQGIWAPDIVHYQNGYYIYYSFCGVPAAKAPCVIGLYTTPTLDSTAPGYKLTDAGMVVNNPTNDSTYQFSTIDPGPIIDPSGNLWSSWGSGYGKDQTQTQLWLTRLDTMGLPLASDMAYKPPAVLGHALETGRPKARTFTPATVTTISSGTRGAAATARRARTPSGSRAHRGASPAPTAATRSSTPAAATSTAPGTWASTAPAASSGSPTTTTRRPRRSWARTT